MKKFFYLLVIVCLMSVASACRNQNYNKLLPGTYDYSSSIPVEEDDELTMSAVIEGTVTFNSDNTFSETGKLKFKLSYLYEDYYNTLVLLYNYKSEGSWKIDGDNLVENVKECELTLEDTDATYYDDFYDILTDMITHYTDGFKSEILGPASFSIKSIDEENLVLIDEDGNKTVYVRK